MASYIPDPTRKDTLQLQAILATLLPSRRREGFHSGNSLANDKLSQLSQ